MSILAKLSPHAIKETFAQYRRVLDVSRKPDKDEFIRTAKVAAVGIGVIGLIGFIIFFGYNVIF